MNYNVAIVLTNATRNIIWVNDGFTKMSGFSLMDVLGMSPGQILQGDDTDPEAVRHISECLNREEPVKATLTNYRKNGEAYPCRLVIHPIHDTTGTLTNFIAIEVDGSKVPASKEPAIMKLDYKYKTSSLDKLFENELYFSLTSLMEHDKIFLNPDLSLRDVADQLNTNTKYLSQAINSRSGHNFHRFVNEYRVTYLKEKLTDPSMCNLTLHGIAMQCGFKSKSTFYKVFREITTFTPKQFVKQISR